MCDTLDCSHRSQIFSYIKGGVGYRFVSEYRNYRITWNTCWFVYECIKLYMC